MLPRPYIYYSVLLAALSAMYCFVLWTYPFSFNYQPDIHWHNELLFFSAALYVFFVGGMIALQQLRALNSLQSVVIALPALLLLLFASGIFSFSNERLCVLASLFTAGVVAWHAPASVKRWLWAVVMLAYVAQLATGLWQYAANASVQGTLRNSGVYACYMVAHLPLVYYYLQSTRIKKYAQLLFLAAAAATLALLLINYSRTGVIAFVVILLLLYAPLIRRRRMVLAGMLVLVMAGVAVAGSYVFNVKRLSSWGRVMKWDIARAHAGDDVLFGTGIGRFTWHYPQWQAAYFRDTPSPPADYYMSAGESFILFNEYLQLFLEAGLAGAMIFLLALYLFFKTPVRDNRFARCLQVMAAGILVCGFTSYPLHTNPMLFLLALGYATVRAGTPRSKPVARPQWVLWPVLLAAMTASYFCFGRASAVRQWKYASNNYGLTQQQTNILYHKLYARLRDDGKFLAGYARMLMEQGGNCAPAAALLEKSKQHFITIDTYYAAARAYNCLGRHDLAIAQYQFIAWYVPVLFRPKYEMARLYMESGQTAAAMRLARQVVSMPVKIPSPEIDQMKAEMKQLILQINGHTYKEPAGAGAAGLPAARRLPVKSRQ